MFLAIISLNVASAPSSQTIPGLSKRLHCPAQLLRADQGSILDSGLSLSPLPYIRSIHKPCLDPLPQLGPKSALFSSPVLYRPPSLTGPEATS